MKNVRQKGRENTGDNSEVAKSQDKLTGDEYRNDRVEKWFTDEAAAPQSLGAPSPFHTEY
jgi:hypothetical protein